MACCDGVEAPGVAALQQVYEEAKAVLAGPCEEEGAAVRALGGLRLLGTERHESRRIDQQLRGRAGRQGDPGSSRFILSLEDKARGDANGNQMKTIWINFLATWMEIM